MVAGCHPAPIVRAEAGGEGRRGEAERERGGRVIERGGWGEEGKRGESERGRKGRGGR